MPRIRPPVLAQAPPEYSRRFFDQIISELRDVFARIDIPASDASYYGQINRNTNQIVVMGAGWTSIQNYTAQLTNPKGVVQDMVPGTLSLQNLGVYQLMIDITLTFDESNTGRSTNLRMFDVGSGLPFGVENSLFVGRNAAGLTSSFVYLFEAITVGRVFCLQIGGGDAFPNTRIEKIVFGVATV